MMIWWWIGALLIGLVLGLLGSGGSILTVPVLVYLVGEPEKLAIAESLGIVMLISMVGAIPFALKRLVDWRSVLYFGVPAMIGSYGGAYVSQFVPGSIQLSLFAGVMLVAAIMMFRGSNLADAEGRSRHATWKIVSEGLAVGAVTGLVGVGGGFLIVPALVLLGGLSMHLAVGTSLIIIALKSMAGVYKYIELMNAAGFEMNWDLILLFSSIGIFGSLAGKKVGEYVSQMRLKQVFAGFLIVMGAFVLWQSAGSFLRNDKNALVIHNSSNSVKTNSDMPIRSFLDALRPGRENPDPTRERLTTEEFLARLDKEAVVIDVRTPREFEQGHLAGAELMNLQAPDFRDRIATLDRTKTYYLYCRSGNRSGSATRIMRGMGFTNVYNVGAFDELVAGGATADPAGYGR